MTKVDIEFSPEKLKKAMAIFEKASITISDWVNMLNREIRVRNKIHRARKKKRRLKKN